MSAQTAYGRWWFEHPQWRPSTICGLSVMACMP